MPKTERESYALWIGILTLIGFFLRVFGIHYGLPYAYHPDEPLSVNIALAMGYARDPNPHWFLHPSLYFYVLCLIYGIYFVAGIILGAWSSAHDFAIALLRDSSPLYWMGRSFSVLLSTGAIPLTYLAGKRLFTAKVGLLAAVVLTPAYLPVYFGHFIKVESLQVFLTLLAFLFCIGILKTGTLKNYIAAGLCAGLAAASKYPSILIVLAYVAAHFFRNPRQPWYRCLDAKLAAGLTSSFLGFAIGAPFCLLQFPELVKSFSEIHFYATPRLTDSSALISGWIENLKHDVGTVSLLLFACATLYSFFRPSKEKLILLIFPLTHFILFSLPAWKNVHWQVVTLPFFAIAAGRFLEDLWQRGDVAAPMRAGAQAAILLAATCGPLIQVARYDLLLARTDTRTLAKEWIERHIPAGTKIAMERGRFLSHDGPPLQQSRESIAQNYLNPNSPLISQGYRVQHAQSYYRLLSEAVQGITYDITPILYDPFAGQSTFWKRQTPSTLQDYQRSGIRYMITCGFENNLWKGSKSERGDYAEALLKFYGELKSQTSLIQEFRPIDRLGPHIQIHKL